MDLCMFSIFRVNKLYWNNVKRLEEGKHWQTDIEHAALFLFAVVLANVW